MRGKQEANPQRVETYSRNCLRAHTPAAQPGLENVGMFFMSFGNPRPSHSLVKLMRQHEFLDNVTKWPRPCDLGLDFVSGWGV